VDAIRAERTRLAAALTQKKSVVEVFPSDANFLLVWVIDADALYQHLANNGVIVRNRSREIHCHNCLRITVGTPEENDTLLSLIP
jgi:histidinol-phosphate aminotransferase